MATIHVCDPYRPNSTDVQLLADALARGVAVVPTDSVYGIGCAAVPENPGHARVFAAKRRSRDQSLPLVIADTEELSRYADDLSSEALLLARAYWPGALTLIVRSSRAVPSDYVRFDGTVGLRVPDLALLREALRVLSCPVALTSANIHGQPAPVSVQEISSDLLEGVDLVMDGGPCKLGVSSTVVDVTQGAFRIVREGALTQKEIETVCSQR